jgi:hypothetical protein
MGHCRSSKTHIVPSITVSVDWHSNHRNYPPMFFRAIHAYHMLSSLRVREYVLRLKQVSVIRRA